MKFEVPKRSSWITAAGVIAGLALPLAFGEAFMWLRPPENVRQFLDGDPILRGPYRSDPVLRVAYPSPELYRPAEAPMLADIKKTSPKPTWFFFGVSFARGLWLTSQTQMPSYRTFMFREIDDRLHMRVNEARMILDYGIEANHLVFVLIPLEIARYTETPLSYFNVNRQGKIVYSVRRPPHPFNWLTDHSRIALLAWVRARRHNALPNFRLSTITDNVPQTVQDDFRLMFGELGRLEREKGVPVTVVLLPDRRQVLYDNSNYALQKTFAALAKEAGIDLYDPVEMMRAQPDRWALFGPDWHYTELGYGLVLKGLADHIERNAKPRAANGGLLQ
ncbi:MAG: hypothetical protein KF748_05735 [Xanthobacteraceae bacterium]|nr:hypothetical protein [Xanthobacteraceae bacterium]